MTRRIFSHPAAAETPTTRTGSGHQDPSSGAPNNRVGNQVQLGCLIVDDNPRFLQSARFLLEYEGLIVVGTASSSAQGLKLARQLNPDVVLVDVRLGSESGFDLARQLSETQPPEQHTCVILVSTHTEAAFVDLVQASHSAGYLPKAELSAHAVRRLHAAWRSLG
ncbi:MAG: response regulator [Solirubrobacteraceae bacterium]